MMKINKLNYSESMNLHATNHYVAPRVEVIEVAVEKGYAATGEDLEGYAPDTNDSEFGGANYSTRSWGNLWETGN